MYYAFIQFAGFTMGKAVSQFDAPWTNYPGNNFDGLVGGGGTVTGINQFTYTADFGQGVTAAFSAEDPTAYMQAGNQNLSSTAGAGAIAGITTGALGSNSIRRFAFAEPRRYGACRPGLGSVPGVGGCA